eukprot:UN33635
MITSDKGPILIGPPELIDYRKEKGIQKPAKRNLSIKSVGNIDEKNSNSKVAIIRTLKAWLKDSELRDKLTNLFLIEDIAQYIIEYADLGRSNIKLVTNKYGTTSYSTTGSGCLDMYFQVQPQRDRNVRAKTTFHKALKASFWNDHFKKAWNEDALTTLKIIFHLGGTRIGKSDNYNFYHGLVWLYRTTPCTLISNLDYIPEICYWKALLELLVRITEGDEKMFARDSAMQKKRQAGKNKKCLDLKTTISFLLRTMLLNYLKKIQYIDVYTNV